MFFVVCLLSLTSQCRSARASPSLSPSSSSSQYLSAITWDCILCLDDTHTHGGIYTPKARIGTYTAQQHNNLRPLVIRKSPKPVVPSVMEERGGGRFPSYIKGEVVASVSASLHLSPVYSNHTVAVSSPAFILLYFSISLFCFSPDSDWVSSAPGEQSYEPDVLS